MSELLFDAGTLTVAVSDQLDPVPDYLIWDSRAGTFRMRACDYSKIVMLHVLLLHLFPFLRFLLQ